jgi:hypothetical protein
MKSSFLALALAAALAIPASADLTYYGPHRDEALKAYAALPERGKALPCLAWELTGRGYLGQTLFGKKYLGIYDPDAEGFALSWDEGAVVFCHEYGHHVYFKALSADERKRWASWWADHKSLMPRDYARSNAAEGWADSYAAVYYAGSFLKAGPELERELRSYFPAP